MNTFLDILKVLFFLGTIVASVYFQVSTHNERVKERKSALGRDFYMNGQVYQIVNYEDGFVLSNGAKVNELLVFKQFKQKKSM